MSVHCWWQWKVCLIVAVLQWKFNSAPFCSKNLITHTHAGGAFWKTHIPWVVQILEELDDLWRVRVAGKSLFPAHYPPHLITTSMCSLCCHFSYLSLCLFVRLRSDTLKIHNFRCNGLNMMRFSVIIVQISAMQCDWMMQRNDAMQFSESEYLLI